MSLFLVIAFPFHLWTLIQIFQDIEWVMERTKPADVYGYASYSLIFAFYESFVILILMLLLGFLTPKKWTGDKLVVQLGYLAVITSVWSMLEQIYNTGPSINKEEFILSITELNHPVRVSFLLGGLLLVVVIGSVALPIYLVDKNEKFEKVMIAIFERLNMLSALYIFLDFIGLIIILYRNIV